MSALAMEMKHLFFNLASYITEENLKFIRQIHVELGFRPILLYHSNTRPFVVSNCIKLEGSHSSPNSQTIILSPTQVKIPEWFECLVFRLRILLKSLLL